MNPDCGARLIKQFAAQGGAELVVSGGEPLDHPDLLQFLRAAKDERLHVTLFSMGVAGKPPAVPHELLRQLVDVVDVFRVSLHSAEPAGHDAVTRIPGSFLLTRHAIDEVTALGLTVAATAIAYPNNVDDLPGIARMCAELGISELRIVTVVHQGRASIGAPDLNVPTARLERALADACTEGVRVRLGESAAARQGRISDCRAVQEELVVNWEGWISPCHAVEPFPSESDYDNALRSSLTTVLCHSPRLSRCRELAREKRQGGCNAGCLARQALVRPP